MSRQLGAGEKLVCVEILRGGITAETRKLTVRAPDRSVRHLVLRSYSDRRSLRRAEDWLDRETDALTALTLSDIPAPTLVAADPVATHCEFPSLLMSYLPGRTMLFDDRLDVRIPLLARQLVAIHALKTACRPPEYSTASTADTVVVPDQADPEVWAAAIDVIRRPAPEYEGRILHRDFQPGNVLFDASAGNQIAGVVDWGGYCWGPADLDVAHCSTNLALLHGPEPGARFAGAYEESGGALARKSTDRLYWRVRDALACSEEVQSWATPWREAGRTDLTESVVEKRLDGYISLLMNEIR